MEAVLNESETNTPRRSDRLEFKKISSTERRKELRKRRLAAKLKNESSDTTSSSEEEQNYTPSLKRMKRTNDFTKVYNSYNMDRDLDYYEDDFIDDSDQIFIKNKASTSKLKLKRKISVRRVILEDSDDDGTCTNKLTISNNDSLIQLSSSKRNQATMFDATDEEQIKSKRNRRVLEMESSDGEETPQREPSVRAVYIQQQKDEEKTIKFKELLACRAKKGPLVGTKE